MSRSPRRLDVLRALTETAPAAVAPYSSVPNFVQRLVGNGLTTRDVEAFLVMDRMSAGTGWCDLSAEGLARQLRSTYGHRKGERVARSTANECFRRMTEAKVMHSDRRIVVNLRGERRDLPARRYLVGSFRRAGRKVAAARAARAQANAQNRRSLLCPNSRTPTESEELQGTPETSISTPEGRLRGLAACRSALKGGFLEGDPGPDTPRPAASLPTDPQ